MNNKATQAGQKIAVTFFANGATKAPSNFCRWWRRYTYMDIHDR